jgi:hypothetical protein
MPEALAQDVAALTGCIAGAAPVDELQNMLRAAGFQQVRVTVKEESRGFIADWLPGSGAEQFVVSANIEAVKTAPKACCGPSCC